MSSAMAMTNHTPTPIAGVSTSIHERGMVLFHPASGQMFASNRTGAHIWQALQAGRPLDAIVAEIGQLHQAPLETVWHDARRFIAELDRRNLLERGC